MAALAPLAGCKMAGLGFADRVLTEEEISTLLSSALQQSDLEGKRVLVIIPDSTRTAPIPTMFRLLHRELSGHVAALDYLIALGTHRAMTPEQINALVGVEPPEWATTFTDVHIFN